MKQVLGIIASQRHLGPTLQHREWLEGMLARYREQKPALKAIKVAYQDETPWITPASAQEEA